MNDAIRAFRAEIVATLGNAPETIEPGRLHRFSTNGRHGDLAGWCKLFDDLRGGVFGCFRRDINETWSAADRSSLSPSQRAALARQVIAATVHRDRERRRRWAENMQRIAQLWAQCVPLVPGDPVTQYLSRRGIADVWPLPQALRLHRALRYWDDSKALGDFPAMVAPIVSPSGRIVALHRTYLTEDGRKAAVPSPKKLTGVSGCLAGACIPLHKPARGRVGIAEGIETALAAWCASAVPTVASYCASSLAKWQWPAGTQQVVIFADADKTGREAANTLRARAVAALLRCELLVPTTEGADWCDVWAAGSAVLIGAEDTA